MSSIFKDFLCSTKKLEEKTLLNVLVTLDCWSDRGAQNIEHILLFSDLTNVLNVLLAQTWLLFFSEQTGHTRGHNLSSESASSHSHVNVRGGPVDTSHFDSVTRLDAVNEVVLQNDSHTAG